MNTKAKRPVYYKAFGATDVKADKESRKVSGYLAAFNNIDSDGDVLMPGCFLKSINDRGPSSPTARKIAYCWQHDMKNPIGHFTLLQETEKGLYFEAVIDEIEIGDRALTQYASGTLNQHSIGFRYVWDKCKFEDRKDEAGENVNVFVCYELQLFEGSVVTMGANENTMFEGVKSEDIDAETDKLNKEMDDTLSGVPAEKQYEIRQLVTKYIALAEHEPIDSLKEKVKPLNTDKLINAFKNL